MSETGIDLANAPSTGPESADFENGDPVSGNSDVAYAATIDRLTLAATMDTVVPVDGGVSEADEAVTGGVRILGAALHGLRFGSSEPVITAELLELTPDLERLFGAYIERSLANPQLVTARWMGSGQVRQACQALLHGSGSLIEIAGRFARRWDEVAPGASSQSSDLVVLQGEDASTGYGLVAVMKLDLGSGFRRQFIPGSEGASVRILPVDQLLPSSARRLQKAAFIPSAEHGLPYDLVLLDQQTGEGPAAFFTERFLECEPIDGPRELTRKLARETENWIREEGVSPSVALQARQAVAQAVTGPEVDLERVAEQAFSSPDHRSSYLEHLEGQGFEGGRFSPDPGVADRLSSNMTYILDGGVRISGDAERLLELLRVDPDPTEEGKVRISIETARFERRC